MLNDYKNNLNLFYFLLEHQSFSKKPDSIFTRNEKIFNHPLLQDYLGKSFCNFLLALNSLFKNKQFQDRASMLMSAELSQIISFNTVVYYLYQDIDSKMLLSEEDKNKLRRLLIKMIHAIASLKDILDFLLMHNHKKGANFIFPKFNFKLRLFYVFLFTYYVSILILSPLIPFFERYYSKTKISNPKEDEL